MNIKKNPVLRVMRVSLFLFAALLLLCVPILTLAAHTHQYQITITKEPTCTEKGQKLFQCDCGQSYTEDLQPLGHDTNKVKQIEPSCNKEGQVIYQCSRCKKETIEPIPAKIHHPGKWTQTIKPGLFKSGKSVVQCELCHKQLQSKILKPTSPIPLTGVLGITAGCVVCISFILISFLKKHKNKASHSI